MNVISFPKLGLTFNINPVAFSVGVRPVYWYAIIILTGVLAGLAVSVRSAKKRGVDPDNLYDVCIYGLLAAIIGARAYYVIFDFKSFQSNISDIFKIWEGGLAIYGGIIGAVAAAFIYCKIKKLNFLKIADLAAPGMILGQAIGRYGNFFNAEVYGYATSLPWGMSINGGDPVHPLFFYESLWNIIGFVLILVFRDRKKAHGQVFFGYILWYSFGRFFLEGMRLPEYILYLFEGVGVSQVFAAILVIICTIIIIWLGKNKKIVPVDSIIFDLDGTLWDATKSIVRPWNEAAEEHGIDIEITQQDLQEVMGFTLDEIADKFFPDEAPETKKSILKTAVIKELIYLSDLGGELYPQLKETLRKLKSTYKLFIVSNCEMGYIEAFLDFHDMHRYFFDYEFIGRTHKEKSENIKMIAERNSLVHPVYVGDTIKDKTAAEKAGVDFIHAAYGFGEIDGNVKKINEISELPFRILDFQ